METAIKDIQELKIHGRTTACREPLTLFWTASGFECHVSGTELWVEVEITYDVYEPWFSYTIDEEWIGRQMLVKGRYWIPLFRGMNPEKIKRVRFFKDLQAMSGDGNSFMHIHAFRHDGKFYQVPERRLKIEFIGDSITSGEGAIGAKEEEDWIPMFFSSIRNYAYMTAEQLQAEYRVFSQSGWGVHNTWDNNLNGAIPKYYKEICSLMPGDENERLGGKQLHDFSAWQPDVIVINLGTNDASSFDQPEWVDEITGKRHKMRRNENGTYHKKDIEKFENAGKAFLHMLRECNPKARIVWCYGMLGLDFAQPIQNAVSSYINETADEKVSYLELAGTNDTTVGARCHPGYLCHQQAAETLVSYLTQIGL